NELFKKEALKLGSDDARYIGPAAGPEPDGFLGGASYKAVITSFKDELKVDRTDEYRQRQFPPEAAGRRGAGGRGGGGGGGGWAYANTAPPFSDFPHTTPATDRMT